ncbi:hypothetical protein [Geodermatophilus sp. SYSU D00684]
MVQEQRLAEVFVELADTLAEEFDVVDLLQILPERFLTERCVELVDTDTAGLLLADQPGNLRLVAHAHESWRRPSPHAHPRPPHRTPLPTVAGAVVAGRVTGRALQQAAATPEGRRVT